MSGRVWYHHLVADSGVAQVRLAVSALVFPAGSAWDSAAASRSSILRSKAVSWRSMTEAVCSPLTMPDDGSAGRRRLAGSGSLCQISKSLRQVRPWIFGLRVGGRRRIHSVAYRYRNRKGD